MTRRREVRCWYAIGAPGVKPTSRGLVDSAKGATVQECVSDSGERSAGADRVNSRAYWDGRFAGDWDDQQGPAQSRWFAELALAHLPRWLVPAITAQRLSVVDWGCAEGDGTAVWAEHVAPGQLVGVEFSARAVATAAARYPAVRFSHEDWLSAPTGEPATYDVVFSSNTLEHFAAPEVALAALARRASKAVLLLVPYREDPLGPEHFVSFSPDRVPARLPGGLPLCWWRVLDCRRLAGAHFAGQQLLTLHADPGWTAPLVTSLSDLDSGVDALLAGQDRLDSELTQLKAELDRTTASAAALAAQLRERAEVERWLTERIRFLEQRHAARLSTRLYRRYLALTGRGRPPG